jgi:hypothetical protein
VVRPGGARYKRCLMRLVGVIALLAAGLACGCGAEQPRPVIGQDDITAAHLRNLGEDRSALRNLEPTEEDRRSLAEEELVHANAPAGEEGWSEDQDLEEVPTTQEKWEQASIAVLQVAVTVGAMVAPYFLF